MTATVAPPLVNWAGNLAYSAPRVHHPQSVEELQALVAASRSLRALGTRHSFNAIADTPGDLIAMDGLSRVVALDPERRTVTVEGGIRYGELCRWLHSQGFALHNLASLPHISVAGACATATHGSGDRNGNLATAVVGLDLVRGDGELERVTQPEQLAGAVVGLGCAGVVARLTLAVEPAYDVAQTMYGDLALDQLEANVDAIFALAYSVSVFTDWRRPELTQILLKRRVALGGEPPRELFSATRAGAPRHPISGRIADNCTIQQNIPGPWHERLPHFRLEFTPSVGEELQSEYFVPRAHAAAAIATLRTLAPELAPILQISEIRSVAADELWLSPCYQRDSIGLHFTWIQDWPAIRARLPLLEAALAPFAARPHWGKLFTMAPEQLQAHYQRLPDFRRLVERLDPTGKFRNPFVAEALFS